MSDTKRCVLCKLELSLDRFYKSGGYCQDCRRTYDRERRQRYKTAHANGINPPVEVHQCFTCREIKPVHEFWKNRANPNGLTAYCKVCFAKRNAADYQKKKDVISRQRHKLKLHFVEQLGGKCMRCGYHEFLSGLDFHHLGTEAKEAEIGRLLTLAQRGNGKQQKRLEQELRKTILLCRNCHSGLHANEWQLDQQLPLLPR